MTEILTESFCERCGTRYTFESAKPRVRLKGVKVLSRGLKNFVLSDDTSMDEAMAAARSETDRESTAHQLDAFHKTFNFCMSCRQYTCPNCWNEPEARCLTCAPLALAEEPAIVDDLRAFRDAVLIGEPGAANGSTDHEHEHEPWSASPEPAAGEAAQAAPHAAEAEGPQVDIESEAPLAAVEATAPEIEAAALEVEQAAPGTAPAPVSEPAAAATATQPEAAPAPSDPTSKAAAQTAGLLQRFRPGQSLDDELDAFERERTGAAAMEATTEEPVSAAAELEPAPQLAADGREPEAVEATPLETAAEVAPVSEPEPVAMSEPAAVSEPAAEPELEPLAAASASDIVEQPTWRISTPDAIGVTTPTPPPAGDAGVPLQAGATPAAQPDAEPQWPTRPQWPSTTPTAGLPFLGRPAAPQGGIEALWAASNQEVVTAAPPAQGRKTSGIQPCISCGLSLSANARFCRRCGTLQGH